MIVFKGSEEDIYRDITSNFTDDENFKLIGNIHEATEEFDIQIDFSRTVIIFIYNDKVP